MVREIEEIADRRRALLGRAERMRGLRFADMEGARSKGGGPVVRSGSAGVERRRRP